MKKKLALQSSVIVICLLAGASKSRPLQKDHSDSGIPVRVESMLISQLGAEHFGNAVFRRGMNGPCIK